MITSKEREQSLVGNVRFGVEMNGVDSKKSNNNSMDAFYFVDL